MPALDVRLRLVNRLPKPARIAALESALAVAGAEEGSQIALQLLEIAATEKPIACDPSGGIIRRRRKCRPGVQPLLALLRAWTILGEDERAATVAVAGPSIAAALETMAEDRRFQHRVAAAKVAAGHPTADTLPILSRLIIDSDEDVQGAAEQAIEAICASSDRLDPPSDEALDRLLAEVGRTFPDHRRSGVISAIASRIAQPGPRLAGWLLDEHQPGLLVLRGLLRRDRTPAIARAAIRLLDHPTLCGAARTRLECINADAELHAALSRWPDLLNPARARALASLRRPDRIAPGADDMARLSAESKIGACVWSDGMRLRAADRASLLTSVALGDDRRAALAAIRRLAALPRPDAGARNGLFQATNVADDRLAELATSSLIDDRSPAARTWMRGLDQSAHPGVRRMANESNRRTDPWASIAADDPYLDAHAALRTLQREREPFITRLRELIRKGEAPARIRAMRLAWRLGVDSDVELELLKALYDQDSRVVASSVMSLRRLPTSAARSALVACLDHADDRVAANAVEAIAWREPDHHRVRMAADNKNARARANALRARIVCGSGRAAAEQLHGMLHDERPSHRLSALWVAQRTGQSALARDIAILLDREDDERVRERGRRCARVLLAQLRSRDSVLVERKLLLPERLGADSTEGAL